jgi:uncharacterized membrane protein YhaH (DUF805 family)
VTWLGALLFWPVAWGLGRILLPARSVLPRSMWEEACASYLLGVALITTVGTMAIAAAIPFAAAQALTMSGGLAACGWLAWRRRKNPDVAWQALEWSRPLALLLGALALGAAAMTLAMPLNETDPLLHFAYRGKILHHHGSVLNDALLGLTGPQDYGRIATHPNYPLGVPILEAWVAQLGGWSDRWVQAPLAWMAACLPGAVALGLRGISLAAARGGALLAACTPMIYVADLYAKPAQDLTSAGLGGDLTLGGGGDLPLAALFALGCALLMRALSRPQRARELRTAAAAGLAFAGGVAMKNEGLALAGVAFLALLLSAALPPRPRWQPALTCVAVTILASAAWLVVRAQLPAIDENYGAQFTPARVMEVLGGMEELPHLPGDAGDEELAAANAPAPLRRDLVAAAFGAELIDLRTWGLLWLASLAALALTIRRWRDADARWLALVVGGGLLLYALILLVTPWHFPSLREKGIPERLMIHLVGPCALLVGAAFSARPKS